MDMTTIRKMVMAQMANGNLPTGWKIKKITFNETISTADQMITVLESELSNILFAFCVKDRDYTQTPSSNEVVEIAWVYNISGASFVRYFAGYYQSRQAFSSSIAVAIESGATFTVMFYE